MVWVERVGCYRRRLPRSGIRFERHEACCQYESPSSRCPSCQHRPHRCVHTWSHHAARNVSHSRQLSELIYLPSRVTGPNASSKSSSTVVQVAFKQKRRKRWVNMNFASYIPGLQPGAHRKYSPLLAFLGPLISVTPGPFPRIMSSIFGPQKVAALLPRPSQAG